MQNNLFNQKNPLWAKAMSQADNIKYIKDRRAKRLQESLLLNTLISALKGGA